MNKNMNLPAEYAVLSEEEMTYTQGGSDIGGVCTPPAPGGPDPAPTQSCNVHKMVRYCKDGKHLATEYCPASSVVEIAALDWNREIIKDIKAQDDEYLLQTLTGKEEGELCPVHNKKPSIFPIIPGDDDDDSSDTRFGSWSDWWDKLLP